MLGERIAQFLRRLVFLQQFLDARHIIAHLPQLGLYLLQSLLHDVHTQVEHQVEYVLAQTALPLLQLEALAQLVAVDGQLRGQTADLHVGVLHKVTLRHEALLTAMSHGLGEDLVVSLVVELQVVLRQVEADVLCHGEVHCVAVFRLHILEDHLLAVPDDALHQQSLHLAGLFIHRMDADKLGVSFTDVLSPRILTFLSSLFSLRALSARLLLPLLHVLADHVVHRVQ